MKPNCVWVYLSELPPNQMVEFGHVLPLRGEEVEWSAALPEAEKARLEKIGIRKEVAVRTGRGSAHSAIDPDVGPVDGSVGIRRRRREAPILFSHWTARRL
jgi:hypothetical protein